MSSTHHTSLILSMSGPLRLGRNDSNKILSQCTTTYSRRARCVNYTRDSTLLSMTRMLPPSPPYPRIPSYTSFLTNWDVPFPVSTCWLEGFWSSRQGFQSCVRIPARNVHLSPVSRSPAFLSPPWDLHGFFPSSTWAPSTMPTINSSSLTTTSCMS